MRLISFMKYSNLFSMAQNLDRKQPLALADHTRQNKS